jgi:hypothetical protein
MDIASQHPLIMWTRPLADLYRHGGHTMLALWEENARGAKGAAVHRRSGVGIAVFPRDPERAVYNNALLERQLAGAQRAEALDEMEVTYAAAGVTNFAAWVHESEQAMRQDLERRGYKLNETTRAMGMMLEHTRLPGRKSSLHRRTGSSTCASWVCRQRSCAIPTAPPSMSRPHAAVARTWPLQWRSITAATVGSTTSQRRRQRGLFGVAIGLLQPIGAALLVASGTVMARRLGSTAVVAGDVDDHVNPPPTNDG